MSRRMMSPPAVAVMIFLWVWLSIGMATAQRTSGTTGKGAVHAQPSIHCQLINNECVCGSPGYTGQQIPCTPGVTPQPQASAPTCIYYMDPSRIDEMLQARPGVCRRYATDRIICQNTTSEQCNVTLYGGTTDEWDNWNRRLADAISDEFKKHRANFRSQYGGDRVPLKVTIKYYVQGPPGPPTRYMNKQLTYGIWLQPNGVTVDAIPYGNYNLTGPQLRRLQENFKNIAIQSLYATMASYQSRLKFPEGSEVPNGRYSKTGVFSNDPNAPELKYADGPTLRY